MSLRERKKQLTRETIAFSAFQIAEERGLSELTVEEIARRAFVSTRTVSNYFPSKEAAVVHRGTAFWAVVLENYGSHPAAATLPLLALRDLAVARARALTSVELAHERRRQVLIERHASLRRHDIARYDEVGAAVRAAVARATGTDPERSMHPRLVAGAALVAVHTAVRTWATSDVPLTALPAHIVEAFNHAADGSPAPSVAMSA